MDGSERIYRDALAVREGGTIEVVIDDDRKRRVDVLIHGTDATSDTLIEVKHANEVERAVDQVKRYGRRWTTKNELTAPPNLRIHLILDNSRLNRVHQARRIEEMRSAGELAGLTVTTEIDRADLPAYYQLAHLSWNRKKTSNIATVIQSRVKQIRYDVEMTGYLSPEYKAVLTALMKTTNVSSVPSEKQTVQLVNDWLMHEHYRWLSRPLPIACGG